MVVHVVILLILLHVDDGEFTSEDVIIQREVQETGDLGNVSYLREIEKSNENDDSKAVRDEEEVANARSQNFEDTEVEQVDEETMRRIEAEIEGLIIPETFQLNDYETQTAGEHEPASNEIDENNTNDDEIVHTELNEKNTESETAGENEPASNELNEKNTNDNEVVHSELNENNIESETAGENEPASNEPDENNTNDNKIVHSEQNENNTESETAGGNEPASNEPDENNTNDNEIVHSELNENNTDNNEPVNTELCQECR